FVTKFTLVEDIPHRAQLYLNSGYGPCGALEIISHDDRIVAGFDSGNTVVLDRNLAPLKTGRYCHNQITSLVAAGADQSRLVIGDLDGRLVLIDTTDDGGFQPVTFFEYAHDGAVTGLAPSRSDPNLVVSAGADRSVLQWDLREPNGGRRRLLTTLTQATALHWPEADRLLFGTEAGHLVLFDLRTRQPLANRDLLTADHLDDQLDRSVRKIIPLSDGSFAVLAAKHHWIYDRSISTMADSHQYPNLVRSG